MTEKGLKESDAATFLLDFVFLSLTNLHGGIFQIAVTVQPPSSKKKEKKRLEIS